MIPTEPIVLLGPTVIMKMTAFLVLVTAFYFALKYGERFYRKYLTTNDSSGTLSNVESTMNLNMNLNELNLPASKLTVTRTEAFVAARRAALSIGKQVQFVTADDVYFRLEKEGIPVAALGSAAGNIFRNRAFKPTDMYVKSRRLSNRGRRIRTYMFVGN